jgi:hypothetical protein
VVVPWSAAPWRSLWRARKRSPEKEEDNVPQITLFAIDYIQRDYVVETRRVITISSWRR